MPEVAGLYFEEHGPRGGPPVILSAGLGGMSTYWAPNLPALARDHRILVYDHRGTGRSHRDLPDDLAMESIVSDVMTLIDHVGVEKVTLIGHALGGIMGLYMALLAPGRLERLVVVNGFAKPDRHFLNCMNVRLSLLRDTGLAAFIRAQPLFLYPARWIVENFDRLAEEEAAACLSFQGVSNLEKRIDLLASSMIDSRLGEIRAPVLLVAADDDMLVASSASELLASKISGSTLATMTGGHACNVTHPDQFNRIVLGWLAGLHSSKE